MKRVKSLSEINSTGGFSFRGMTFTVSELNGGYDVYIEHKGEYELAGPAKPTIRAALSRVLTEARRDYRALSRLFEE